MERDNPIELQDLGLEVALESREHRGAGRGDGTDGAIGREEDRPDEFGRRAGRAALVERVAQLDEVEAKLGPSWGHIGAKLRQVDEQYQPADCNPNRTKTWTGTARPPTRFKTNPWTSRRTSTFDLF